jgi:phage baseplate assembly protein W
MVKSIYSDFNPYLIQQRDGDVEKDLDVYAVKNAIANILSTRKGTRRMLPNFACDLWRLLFEPMDRNTADAIGHEVVKALKQWEPRVFLNAVNIDVNYDMNQYVLMINYGIVGKPGVSETVRLILRAL